MFSWSADTVRFMADACRRTDFHEKLTALLLPYLKPTDHICDAGCGLGYLSLALSPHAARVTAAERDAAALAVLRQELDARGITNVTPLCADVLAYTPPVPFDAMVFCFFGSMEEILAAARAVARCWPWCVTTCATAFPGHPVRRAAIASMPPAVCWTPTVSPIRRSVRRWTFPSPSAPWRMPGHSWPSTAGERLRRTISAPNLFPPAIRTSRGSCPASAALE